MITVAADTLTYVDLIWIEKRVQRWIRYGSVASEQIIDRHRRIVAFAPGEPFAFVRWASNEFGTVVSRVLFEDCSAFTRVAACTLALSPIRDTLIEGFSHFVTSMTAPIASGWSGCRVGLARVCCG